MENQDLRELFESRLNVMGWMLVWPKKLNCIATLAKVTYLSVFVWLIFLTLSGAVVLFRKDFTLAIINAVDVGCCLSALYKIYYVTMFPNKFHKIMETLKEVEFPPKCDPLYVHLDTKIKLNNLIVTAFKYCAFGAIVFQALPGLYVTCFGEGRKLPVHTYLDANDLPLWLYLFTFISQVSVGINLGLQISYFDGTCFGLISFAVVKLSILKNRLYALNNIIDHTKLTFGAHDLELKEILKQSIKEQVIVNNFVNAIQDAFSIPILAELAVVLILVSILLMSMVFTPFPSVDFFLNICFLSSLMIGNAGFCFHGNELQVESEELWEAQYLLDWHYYGISHRKTVFIMMERTIRPLQITAGPFAVLNNETFLAICNTAFSYFTIILQLYSDSDQSSK